MHLAPMGARCKAVRRYPRLRSAGPSADSVSYPTWLRQHAVTGPQPTSAPTGHPGTRPRPSFVAGFPASAAPAGCWSSGSASVRRQMPSCCARRDPAAPPNAHVICSSAVLNREVRRAYHGAVSGSRSAKMRCPHPSEPQKNRRTRSSIRTGMPSRGRSLSLRLYQQWTRRLVRRHRGQILLATNGRRTITSRVTLEPATDPVRLLPHSATMSVVPWPSARSRQSLTSL